MTGHDFLPLAKRLATGATEVEWRTSVGRSYYAAFHVARQFFQDLRFRVPYADQAHRYLWLRLSNCGDGSVELAGASLNDLRRHRNRADYELNRPFLQSLAQSQLIEAERIINTLDGLIPAARTQITDAMKVYERDVLGDVTWQP
jgi:hypothetical protein